MIIVNQCSNLRLNRGTKAPFKRSCGSISEASYWTPAGSRGFYHSEERLILWDSTKEPINFFYHFCKTKLHPFTLAEFLQRDGGRQNINLLTDLTNNRVVADTRINHNSRDNSSETNSISCELNEAIAIDSLISGACKKYKTTAEAIRISCASEEEGSKAQLERHSKRKADPINLITIVVEAPTSPIASPLHVFSTSSLIALNEDTPSFALLMWS
ncbi:hypothetical protein J1N35_044161 [Gossypium stocksii]|uniref:Uncharacterized protein n=1 Tax=Gossypium stocksii TaxID=47602 RepID=A0A9D3ZFV4_9ROSI|nr:hypothetical protein J1N35_044161 [Gossypium stocksii]